MELHPAITGVRKREREGSGEEQTHNSLANVLLQSSQQAHLIPSLGWKQPLSHSQEWIYKLLLPEAAFSPFMHSNPQQGQSPQPCLLLFPLPEVLIPQGKDVKHSSRPGSVPQALHTSAAFGCTADMQHSYCRGTFYISKGNTCHLYYTHTTYLTLT